MLLAIVVFVVMLLVLVLVHELGHLLAAKWAGCKVEEFGFGFPPKLFSRIWRGTRYSFNLLPLGGFVKIEGENMDDPNPSPTSFASKSASRRVFILAAGVLMNILLAYVLLSWQAAIGAPTVVTDENTAQLVDQKSYILDVVPGSPAEEAGIKAFDRIISIAGIQNPSIEDISASVDARLGREVSLELNREGKNIEVSVAARENPPEGEGAMGVSLAATGLIQVPWWQAPVAGLVRTGQMFAAIVSQFAILVQRIFSEGVFDETLTGPIGIAIYTNEATHLGLSYLLEFTALISINLAIINILPIPALDGGRILFVAFEKVLGRKRINKVEYYAHTAGFVLLIALMVLITFKDIKKYF
ncbi:MAG: RIP metalloprotease RseP [Candidatus Andersenbacteria bacterium]|nr:RIP metalloprotease RseP [Candidatus Andersenbacteria bacterium]MBI3250338.1 RIP metalloprotease RseP [Candidatus Andersenbacteria bacterium]